jgi:hypothetical protein
MAGRQALHPCDLGVGKGTHQPVPHTSGAERDPQTPFSSTPKQIPRGSRGAQTVFTLAPDLVNTISVGCWGFSYTNKAFVPSTHQLPQSP